MSRKTRNRHGNRDRCRIVLRDRIFGYTSSTYQGNDIRGARWEALARPAAGALSGLMGISWAWTVVLGNVVPPPPGG